MIQIAKQWFAPVPWETVISVNQALCQAKKEIYQTNSKSYEVARHLWEKSIPRTIPLQEALDICRQCQDMTPFSVFNANTFAAIGRTLLDDGLKLLPPVEAQVIRTTVSHYIAGMIGKRELSSVLKHFQALWNNLPTAPASPPIREMREASSLA